MPAPPSDLVAALRAGTVARHIFFKMTHSQGTVLAWDGVGDFTYNGDTYLGVAGFMSIEGVSDSGDVQNHEVIATLNGVSLPSLVSVDPNVRGQAASIFAVWISESGAVLQSKTVFAGKADVLRAKLTEETKSVAVKVRAPLAEWRTPPRAYWTEADQERRYPGDTGFKFVKNLENVTVSGWSNSEESSGAIPLIYGVGSFATLRDSIDGAVIGMALYGINFYVGANSGGLKYRKGVATSSYEFYEEDPTGALIAANVDDGDPIKAGGVNCYVDEFGDVRTPGGNLIFPNGLTNTNKLRKQTAIVSNGTPTATTVSRLAGDDVIYLTGTSDYQYTFDGTSWTGDQSALIYDNYWGDCVRALNATAAPTRKATGDVFAPAGTYVEDVTGAAVAFNSGLLKVSGSNCVVSSTGVILTPGGRRVVLSGGTADEFLRVWK